MLPVLQRISDFLLTTAMAMSLRSAWLAISFCQEANHLQHAMEDISLALGLDNWGMVERSILVR